MLTELIIKKALKDAPYKLADRHAARRQELAEMADGPDKDQLIQDTVTTIELSDGGERGAGRLILFMRISTKGITSEWYAVWRRDGSRTKSKLGTYPAMSLSAARGKFRQDYMPEITAGNDPVGNRARGKGITVKELFLAYVEDLKRREAPSARNMERILLGSDGKGGAAAAIGPGKSANTVKPQDIVPHLGAIYRRGSPAMASRTRLAISSAYSFGKGAVNSYKTAENPVWGITMNPVLDIPADNEATKPGMRYLLPSQFRDFWKWLELRDHISMCSPMIRVLMSCGQRITEITPVSTGTDRAVYDRNERIIDWSTTKNTKPHCIPLPRQAVEIFENLHPDSFGHYFPSPVHNGDPLDAPAVWAQVNAYITDTGAEHFTPRDLRRTWKTLAGQAGLSLEIRNRIQNHGGPKDVGSRHYDRWNYMPEKRAAMDQWSVFLDRMLAGEIDNAVVQLHAAEEAGSEA